MDSQIIELIDFLHDPNIQVRAIAVHNIVGFSHKTSGYQPLLLSKSSSLIPDLKALCKEDPITAHDALRSLINLSADEDVCKLCDDDRFLKHLSLLITIPKSVLADLACMLLSNLSKSNSLCHKLLLAKTQPLSDLSESSRLMDHLVDVFVKGIGKTYNAEAEFHFLASVFANVSGTQPGREYFLSKASEDGNIRPITKLIVFTEHDDIIRRGGVILTIKNCCFEVKMHPELLDETDINILPYILLPLCGPEEFDIEDMEGMPEDIQLLPETKKREPDSHLRLILCESLLLLAHTRKDREILRAKKVYPVIKVLDSATMDDNVHDICERIVNLLMRDENDGQEDNEGSDEDDEDDTRIVEIA